jgi:hypothetical protein
MVRECSRNGEKRKTCRIMVGKPEGFVEFSTIVTLVIY